jgi:hypothetical protein
VDDLLSFLLDAVTPERVVSAKRFMSKLEKLHKVQNADFFPWTFGHCFFRTHLYSSFYNVPD